MREPCEKMDIAMNYQKQNKKKLGVYGPSEHEIT